MQDYYWCDVCVFVVKYQVFFYCVEDFVDVEQVDYCYFEIQFGKQLGLVEGQVQFVGYGIYVYGGYGEVDGYCYQGF